MNINKTNKKQKYSIHMDLFLYWNTNKEKADQLGK